MSFSTRRWEFCALAAHQANPFNPMEGEAIIVSLFDTRSQPQRRCPRAQTTAHYILILIFMILKEMNISVENDGTKFLCQLDATLEQQQECVVFSLGSRGDSSFEKDVLARTKCKIWTLDCTVDGTSLDPKRHTYKRWCAGR